MPYIDEKSAVVIAIIIVGLAAAIYFFGLIRSIIIDYKKIKECMELRDEVLKYIRDETSRTNTIHADKAMMMIAYFQKRSFCKETEQMAEEVKQVWKAKFAHLYK